MADTTDNNKEKEVKKSRRDSFRENFKSRHPDVNMDDEESYYSALDDEYNSNQDELNRYRDSNKKLNEMFMENPQAAYFMNDLLDGKKKMGVALIEHFGSLFKDAVNDPSPENVKEFADALDEHAKRIKKNDELQAAFESNIDKSEATIEEWASKNNMKPEQIDAVRDYINQQFGNHQGRGEGEAPPAGGTGMAEGRKQRIKEKLRKGKSDGMPVMPGGGQARERPQDTFLANTNTEDPWAKAKREKF